ncbi:FkbM family methyltransferase [Paraburkholderia phymatum]|uniref:FkbM family methyltransferase n=1 Tax=Paraburkholderia phymatum TaxID=148447 RepID=UPI003172F920
MSRAQALHGFEQLTADLRFHQPKSVAQPLEDARTIYLLAAGSFLGISFANPIARNLLAKGKHVVLVDDTLRETTVAGCELIGSQAFAQAKPVGALAINLGNATFAAEYFSKLASRAGVAELDVIPVLDVLGLPVIYETASVMREATLQRLPDYLSLANKLDDALSIQTLGAMLELRVRLDRRAVLPVLLSLEDEYFSPYPAGKDLTFTMGPEEIFCDIGAHVGSTIRKLLTATHWSYDTIYAFEPDAINYGALSKGVFTNLERFKASNIALSDTRSVLSFSETGTMGSRLDNTGNVQVQASTLDDEVPRATFIKMDVEGHEVKILQGARRLIASSKPRMAITGYHYADDLLNIANLVHEIEPRYRFRLRHHSYYYFDSILYADIPS